MSDHIDVVAPARLHFGLINTSSGGDRLDGGAGLMLDSPELRVRACLGRSQSVSPPTMLSEVRFCLERLGWNPDTPVEVRIEGSNRSHLGFGLTTQLRLSISTSIAAALGRDLPERPLAPILGRGGTSGIGSWGFWRGGFLVDGGHSRQSKAEIGPSASVDDPAMPPLIFNHPFDWWVVVVVADRMDPIFGAQERALFSRYTPTPTYEALQTYATVYGQMVPAIAEHDFASFCHSVELLADLGFKRIEHKERGPVADDAIAAIHATGLTGAGMSSWGPAFFGFAQSREVAESAAEELRDSPNFSFCVATQASRYGAMLTTGNTSVPVSDVVSANSHGPSRGSSNVS